MFDNLQVPKIMGILNVTPDSFSDGGRFNVVESAVQHAQAMLREGADIIDIGGESTRPGSQPVSATEQIARVVPVIQAIKAAHPDVAISIDTTSSAVALAAVSAGATIVNDVSAGEDDPAMLPAVAELQVSIILMHKQGTPATMQDNPYYQHVVDDVRDALKRRVETALRCGIAEHRIALDPGIGFGKRRQDNLDLLAHLSQLVDLGYPVLLGTSRKSFMGSLCAVTEPTELVTATAVTTALGVMSGVKLFRVHDVLANRQALQVAWAIKTATSHAG